MTSDVLRVFFAAMTPVGELRLSIPLGIWAFGMAWQPVLLVSLIGNMIPVVPLLLGLNRLSRVLDRFPGPAGAIWRWRNERIRATYAARIERYGALALVLVVGIPLPFTGAWTGSLVAWMFQVPIRRAVPAIAVGVVLAGAIVTSLVVAGGEAGVILARRD